MKPRVRSPSTLAIYLAESRDIGLSLLMVLPLLLGYEIAMLLARAPLRNGAEVVVLELVRQMPPDLLAWLRRGLLLLLVALAVALARQRPPRVARARWVLAEAMLLALLLGPVVGLLVGRVGLSVHASVATGEQARWLPFLLSIGAGLWEEIVFRLVLLGGLAFLLVRPFGVRPRIAIGVAILVSAVVFALYHHVGDMGEPLVPERFAFRALAGTILGALFAWRGLAVVVYMHVFYDLLCDVQAVIAS